MGLGSQFVLLLWKNWTISRRKVCATVFEIILPIAFALLLLMIRMLVKTEDFPSPTTYEPFQVDNTEEFIPGNRRRILYSPNETKIISIMDKIQTVLGSNATVISFRSEEDILKYIETNKEFVWGAVVFDDTEDYSVSLPNNIKYTLRVARLKKEDQWRTQRNFPFFQEPWYRNNDSQGGTPGYYDTGFLALQFAVDKAIIEEQNPSNNLSTIQISLQKMAFPSFVKDNLVTILRTNLPLFLMLGYIITVFQTAKNIVHEKETRMKESMKLMGLNPTIYWLSWFTKVFIYLLIASLFFTLIFAIKVDGASVLNKTSPVLVLLFLILYGISIICFCFMMSTFFQSANSGAYAAGILYYIFFVPSYFIEYETMSQTSKVSMCLLNIMCMWLGITSITLYEGTGEGATFTNFHKPATVDDNFSLLMSMVMFIVDAVIYSLIAWYVENVRPGNYGVPRPFYFPFTKSYWCGTSGSDDLHDIAAPSNMLDTFEQDPSDLHVGISINRLRKVFGRGKNKKVAVVDTSLNMYEGQITALLGHNGAGKTTTMSMLTGFIPPTKGTAIVNNCDIRKDIEGVRKSLGLCPQHNILFDLLTVEEHLEFFAKLKNVPRKSIKEMIDNMVKILGLQSKRKSYSHTLSGGQKRKLSVGIALMGDAKVIILDEPTSGMDPAARRETWDILQKYKEGRTIVLTTHFMDEADLLGDRIAIMAEGVVKCCGTSHFLKKKYGAGYHLVLVKTKDCDVSKVTDLIQSHISKAALQSNISAELTYLLPFDESKKFEDLFNEMEQKSNELGLSSFGTSATTMEEVFLKVGEGSKSEDDDDNNSDVPTNSKIINGSDNYTNNKINLQPGENGYEMRQMEQRQQNSAFFNSNITKNKGLILSIQQFYGMFVKKAIHSWRNRIVSIVQLSLPVVFTILALLTESTIPTAGDEPSLVLDLSPFEDAPTITYSAGKSGSTPVTNEISSLYKNLFSSYDTENFDTKSPSTMDDFFVNEANRLGLSVYRGKYIIGGEFSSNTTFTAYFNGEAFHTPAVTLGYMMTTLYRKYVNSSGSITTTNHPLPLLLSEKNVSVGTLVTGFLIAYFVLFGMAFLSTSFILFLIKERQTGAKHLQKVSGVSSFAYWLSNFCWDFINYLIPVFVIMIVFAAFQTEPYVNDNRLGIVFLVFGVYGMCCLPFVYVLHYLFSVPSTGMVVVTMLNIATGLAALLTVFILSIPSIGTADVAESLDWVFTVLIPHYCLGQSLNNMYINYDNIRACEAVNYEVLCTFKDTLPCCSGCVSNCINFDKNYLAWDSPGILRNIVFMLVQAALYFTLVCLIEIGAFTRIGYCLTSKKGSSVSASTLNVQEENLLGENTEDSDVKNERFRINESSLTKLMETDALIIKNLAKTYGSHCAVKGINIGVAKQECFGLLGQNGAGKTTTFKMLTGDVFITHGNAYLNTYDVKRHLREVQQNLGYCPQFDALIDQMTGEETLRMYARLRGVQEKQIPEVVDNMIAALMLKKYAKKNCANYSGGNKRKLSTAIALIGDPPFVLLDEPTTGMDPAARRKLWNVLSDVRASGRTLVLTSHSMEECDALCTKIVIMVNGRFVCLGSPQHLKNKFGHGYTLILRLGTDKSGLMTPPDPIKNYIKTTFPDSEIFDDHQGYIHFQIPDFNIALGRVFGTMENAKDQFHIEDYSVHQTTLEQVFLAFTRNQKEPQEKKKGIRCLPCCR